MSKSITFTDLAWSQYLFWQTQDKKTLRRINALIKEVQRTPFEGTGKPEPLKGDGAFAHCWSRRIDEGNRLVYRVHDQVIEIVACRSHYGH